MATASTETALPRVTIQFCTQCKWMLRAAYFAQELLSTFGTALGEVALQPSTGGTFIVEMVYAEQPAGTSSERGEAVQIQKKVLWDRKTEGGFPETKILKRRVRDVIEPGRDLGHVDRVQKSVPETESALPPVTAEGGQAATSQGSLRQDETSRAPSLETSAKTKPTADSQATVDACQVQSAGDTNVCEDCN